MLKVGAHYLLLQNEQTEAWEGEKICLCHRTGGTSPSTELFPAHVASGFTSKPEENLLGTPGIWWHSLKVEATNSKFMEN